MNFYPFHIGDWVLHTNHLSPEEEGVYLRLLNHYYDTERPIPKKTDSVIRRLRLGSHRETVALILAEFFVLEADGWHNLRADLEISAYNEKAERARANGKKGGRPKKQTQQPRGSKTQPVISRNLDETHSEPDGNLEKTGSKANQEPITNNHKNNSSSRAPKFEPVDVELAQYILDGVRRLKPDLKQPNLDTWAEDCRKMRTLDNREPGLIRQVFLWANKDSFWQANILSPAKLRQQFDKLELQSRRGNVQGGFKSAADKRTERSEQMYDYDKATTF